MLSRLYISNYALIDELEIVFKKGLTIITGETGAGKSIVLGALSLILGERADSRAVRNDKEKVVVEATFDVGDYNLADFFAANDIEYFAQECIVRREIAVSGRSRAFINDTPVSVALLKELTTCLIDIHSQHSNMLLSQPQFQLSVLDSIASNRDLLADYGKEYATMKQLESQLKTLKEACARNKQDEDYIRFQLQQIEQLQLHQDEDVELEAQQNKLSNVAETKETLWLAQSLLDGEENAVIGRLLTLAQRLDATERNLQEIEGMAERVRLAIVDLKDIAQTLTHIDDALVDDPRLLEKVNERLNVIYDLQRKHGVKSVNELIEIERKFAAQLATITSGDDRIEALEQQLKAQQAKVKKMAASLSASRKSAATQFEASLKPIAQELGMKNFNFTIGFNAVDFNKTGADAVEFLCAFNKNQDLLPVKNMASGGEISRLMLCVKSIIAHTMHLPTIIFDEVDTGVSGDVANKIGEMMSDISSYIQVLSITHLPQVAAHGNQHLYVYKEDDHEATFTHVKSLNEQEHILEIARMLSGKQVNDAAIENAKSLIKLNNR